MTNGIRNHAGDKTQAELITLGEELAENLDQQKALTAREEVIKARIRELTARYALPVQEGASEYLNLNRVDKALQVTRPAPAVSISDPETLRQRLGCEVFHQCFPIKTVGFNEEVWLYQLSELGADEQVIRERALNDVVTARENKPRISVTKAQKGA